MDETLGNYCTGEMYVEETADTNIFYAIGVREWRVAALLYFRFRFLCGCAGGSI